MNSFNGLGRLAADPEIRYTTTGDAVCKFRIAINRNYKNKDGQYDADFLTCTAFGKGAEVIANYFKKGNQIAITGSVRTGSYEKDGKKVYTTEIAVKDFNFVDKKEKAEESDNPFAGFSRIDEADIPF